MVSPKHVGNTGRQLIWRLSNRYSLSFFGLEQSWRTFLRACSQTSDNLRKNYFACTEPEFTSTTFPERGLSAQYTLAFRAAAQLALNERNRRRRGCDEVRVVRKYEAWAPSDYAKYTLDTSLLPFVTRGLCHPATQNLSRYFLLLIHFQQPISCEVSRGHILLISGFLCCETASYSETGASSYFCVA